MKTVINWREVNLRKKAENNLPQAGEKILFFSGNVSDISKICYSEVFEIEYQPNKLFVTNDLGRTIEIKTGFIWCYSSDIKTQEVKNEHPEITTIAQARKYAGISQIEMSRRLGIPRRSIEDWETGRRIPIAWAERLIINELINIKGNE